MFSLLVIIFLIILYLDSLSIKEFRVVFEEAFDARVKWENIGLQLDVDCQTLNVIQYEHSHSVDDCFKDMLKKWLTGNGERTWSKLAHALENITVGFTNLSDKIKEKYCN